MAHEWVNKWLKLDRLPEEDRLLFQAVTQHIIPLKQIRVQPTPARFSAPRRYPLNVANPLPELLPFGLSDYESELPVLAETDLFFTRPGVRPHQLKALKQGKGHFKSTLDLHGHAIDSAKEKLAYFIEASYKNHVRLAKIIHGKGAPSSLLKNKVNNWLRQCDIVLAFCSALPRDGGTGAVYVLLSKGRQKIA